MCIRDSYKGVEERYVGQAGEVAQGDDVPTVAWISAYPDGSSSSITTADFEPIGPEPAVTFSFARYKGLLTRDAGGAVPSQAEIAAVPGAIVSTGDDVHLAGSEFESVEAMQTAVQGLLEGVDVLIDETFGFTTVVRPPVPLQCPTLCCALCSTTLLDRIHV